MKQDMERIIAINTIHSIVLPEYTTSGGYGLGAAGRSVKWPSSSPTVAGASYFFCRSNHQTRKI